MIKFSQVLFLLNAVWTLTRGDADASCQLGQSYILPCSFQAGDEAIIHWIQQLELTKKLVHSFYHNKDQLDQQDARFKNRTSLFHDQISKGNASLRLTGVMLEDEGRYMCYSSILAGKEEFFVNLKVYGALQPHLVTLRRAPGAAARRTETEMRRHTEDTREDAQDSQAGIPTSPGAMPPWEWGDHRSSLDGTSF